MVSVCIVRIGHIKSTGLKFSDGNFDWLIINISDTDYHWPLRFSSSQIC